MSAKLSELVKQVNRGDIKLVAGKGGYSNQVEWVHMVDNTEIADFLVGGEFTFTTGIGIREDMTLLDLVKYVYKKKASGMVINVGPYIPEIPQEVIDFGNEHDFPLFEVPWEVHMADIMRMFCFTITQSEQRAMELSAAFRYAVFAPQQQELYVTPLMQKGYFAEWNYVAAILDISDRLKDEKDNIFYVPISAERLEILQKKVIGLVGQRKQDIVVFREKEKIVLIFSDVREGEAEEITDLLLNQIKELLRTTETIFAGIGSVSDNIRTLSESYGMARKIVDLSKLEQDEKRARSYGELGMESLLFHIDRVESLKYFCEKTVAPLYEYDKNHGSNLVELLTVYLEHDGSLQDTAEKLFVHRNTINYRLRKIETMLQVDLTRQNVRNNLALGLMAAKIKEIF